MSMKRIIMLLFLIIMITFASDGHRLELFVMSKCPYGARAETQLFNLISQHPEIAENIDIEIHYILNYDEEADNFASLHGKNEVDEDIRQMIIKKYYPDKFWCYLMSKNSHYGDTLWMRDAELCGLKVKKIVKYADKNGHSLAVEEAHLTDSLDVSASPTIFLDGAKVQDWMGDFPTLYRILKNALTDDVSRMKCSADVECPPRRGYITECRDEKCNYRKAPLVNITIISLDTTKYGSSSFQLVKFLEKELENTKVKYIEYGDYKSRELMDKINNSVNAGSYNSSSSSFSISKGSDNKKVNFNILPVYIISNNVREYPAFKRFSKYLIHCELDGESVYIADPNTYPKNAMLDRPAVDGSIDLFVMSECPFSKALEETLFAKREEHIDIENIRFNYVIDYDKNTGKFDSYHGREELEENRRQIIIQKFYPDKFWDYLICYNTSGRSDSCLTAVNIDKDDIERNVNIYADSLLIINAKKCEELNIRSTPTVIVDNRYILSRSKDIQRFFKIMLETGQCGE
ncbi:hypothetical protein J7M00_00170 [bacterium]|nr:hypothetical protein [bacterium]